MIGSIQNFSFQIPQFVKALARQVERTATPGVGSMDCIF